MATDHGMAAVRSEREIGFPTQYGPARTDLKPGHALVPHEAYRDLVIIFLMTGVMFLLTGIGIPELGKSANPDVVAEVELPDWYLLWSWGLLKISELFPQVEIFGLTFSTLFYGFLLTNIPIILLLLWPFIDRSGTESRPAKSAVRAAIGVAAIVWVTTASIYSVNVLIIPRFVTAEGVAIVTDDTLKWTFIVQPVLAGLATYIALRRLAFKPMRRWNTAMTVGALFFFVVLSLAILGLALTNGTPAQDLLSVENLWLGFYVAVALITGILALYIVFFLDEGRGRRTLFRWIGLSLVILVAVSWYLILFAQPIFDHVQVFIMTYSHIFIALPIFAVVVAYFGQRTPYSDYEFKLNECYQCGRCHLVCPITKVDADALGGLNLVYNVYKRQHDGVPMWACLTCDACSAVCPVDINYSEYVLTERARAMRERRRIPERPAATLPTATNGGRRI
ncbi:MAG: 4Fe-4S dicluster domain-containing protein [Thermoplasmata archaeon]